MTTTPAKPAQPSKLSDLQMVLLSSAAARPDGSLLPPPESVGGQLARIRKAIPPLLKRALVAEVEVAIPDQAWREQNDCRLGVVITAAGRAAIGVGEEGAPDATPTLHATDECGTTAGETAAARTVPPTASPARVTKAAQVLALLRREQGATLAELVAATGWLPHTTRAALTGLRKRGHGIAKGKRDGVTCYHIAEAA